MSSGVGGASGGGVLPFQMVHELYSWKITKAKMMKFKEL
jgi:hypothetical protein